jgi:5-methylcytosine-specific restriction endonuclease McrA
MVETAIGERGVSLMDHIVPLARGGKSIKGNVVTACKECNNKKKQLLPMEWEKYLEGGCK